LGLTDAVVAQAAAPSGSATAEFVLFIVVGAVALGSGVALVAMRNAVHAALMLVINFFAIAVLYGLLQAQFLAVIQIIVYAGAIMVLFLFVLMLLGVSRDEMIGRRLRGQRGAAILLGLVLFGLLGAAVGGPYLGSDSACVAGAAGQSQGGQAQGGQAAADGDTGTCVGLAEANGVDGGNVAGLGRLLFTEYVWPFEVTSVLLVIAALGAMVLGRSREDSGELVDRPGAVMRR
jgi:NADH-quinone oxidoreductase subunit J